MNLTETKEPIRLGIQFFADGETDAGEGTANNNTTETNTQSNQQQNQNNTSAGQQQTQTHTTDYGELYKSNKAFQSFVDTIVTKSNSTAVQNALKKQQQLTDERLSESDRLQVMSIEEKAKYFEQKYKAAEQARIRDREVESLKTQTVSMLSENSIPDIFLSVFDFDNATAENIQQRVAMLSDYEYYPKGELDKRIIAAVDAKLKQKTPETHNENNVQTKKYDETTFF